MNMLGNKNQSAANDDINVVNATDLPSDTVSSISWLPDTKQGIFACSSWDSKIRVYKIYANNNQAGIKAELGFETEDPMLSLSWCDDDHTKMFGGCVNGLVKAFDLKTNKSFNVGFHDASVKSVHYIPSAGLVASLSYDKSIRFWDLKQEKPVAAFDLGHKAYCSDMLFPYLCVGLSNDQVALMNLSTLQSTNQPFQYIETPLGKGSQVTAVGFSKDASALCVGTHDGRVNVSKFGADGNKVKLNTVMTFKSKKYAEGTPSKNQLLYPVHDVGFHSENKGFVFTAGGDGAINFWDISQKSLLKNFDFLGAPVTRTKMSPDGSMMAYTLGYDWSMGIQGYQSCSTRVCVHVNSKTDIFGGK